MRTKWNRTTAQATPAAVTARSSRMDPRDSDVDVVACGDLDGPVLTFSTPQWRAFLADLKTGRLASPAARDLPADGPQAPGSPT